MPVGTASDWLAAEPPEDAPLLQRILSGFGRFGAGPAPVAVAVSGGSDSMALLHLAARIARHAGWSLRAVTVDHRLRPEAAGEAALVGRVCAGLGVPHEVLVWQHGDCIAGNLMQAARTARYAMMAEWARGQGIGAVALAHTADDQAETFLIGLSRAAGLDGLTGMRPAWAQAGVTFHRPCLQQTRAELRGYLSRHALSWIDDPSNDNDRFTRIKARRVLKALAPLGISVDRVVSVVRNLALAQAVVQQSVAQAAAAALTEVAGSLQFDRPALADWHPEVRRRLLVAMVRWIGGADHPERASKVSALELALDQGRDATLGGVRFHWKGETCTVGREARACGGPVPVGQVWDGRWQVTGAAAEVRVLGPMGLSQARGRHASDLPRGVLLVTPGVWDGDTLLGAPVAGWENGWKARIVAPFGSFIVSH